MFVQQRPDRLRRKDSDLSQEPLPDLTASDLAREAEQEAAVFTQAANIDKLISMLRGLDPAKDNLADNEEIQVGTLPLT